MSAYRKVLSEEQELASSEQTFDVNLRFNTHMAVFRALLWYLAGVIFTLCERLKQTQLCLCAFWSEFHSWQRRLYTCRARLVAGISTSSSSSSSLSPYMCHGASCRRNKHIIIIIIITIYVSWSVLSPE